MGNTQSNLSFGRDKPISQKVASKRVFQKVMILANLIALIAGVIYNISPGINVFWNIYGIFLILTLLGNIVLTIVGGKYQKLDYLYLVFLSIGMFMIMLINTSVSLDVNNSSSRSIVSIILLNGMFIVGGMIAALRYSGGVETDLSVAEKGTTFKKILKRVLVVVLSLILLVGIYVCYELIFRNNGLLFEMVIPQYGFFYSMIFLSISALILKLNDSNRRSMFNATVLALGMIIFVICALPLASVPSLLNHAEESYSNAFGTEWKNTPEETKTFFRELPFSIPEYFFGTPSGEYIVKEDILYYEGTEGVDQGLKLRFDAYMPPASKENLPGQNSVLIRIHGGAWNVGDKGAGNSSQVNKYFASQGYVVFDLQYGLNNKNKFIKFASVPEEVRGNFTIDDMIRHIGIFTTYLAEYNDEYGANIDSVFISGASAGGQLANAVALGIDSGEYTDILDSRLKIKGIIPLYPANGLPRIGGEEKLVDPDLLVKNDSPPTLIYQGDRDGIVDPGIAKDFRDTYLEKGNGQSALILMPFGSHASDVYFSGYYNQVFIYYMERFMFQLK